MRRRSRPVDDAGAPAWVAEYRPEDWWVSDLECPAAVGYGRISWAVACRAWRRGENPEPYRQPPAWWKSRNN
ncbi:hypothetical protein [Streptomyces sp. NPDC048338]|uniref:hypothetical protein n=1 Tax=Streptomyces sp. NPDC048338 TaxID=3365536 RepID=UPI0037115464